MSVWKEMHERSTGERIRKEATNREKLEKMLSEIDLNKCYCPFEGAPYTVKIQIYASNGAFMDKLFISSGDPSKHETFCTEENIQEIENFLGDSILLNMKYYSSRFL